MATTNILQFDLSRKVNGLTLGSTTLKNTYIGSNKVKEVYLGNKILYINDHKKIQLTTPVSNAYISETPISANESYINIDLRYDNSISYTYINFLSETNAYLTPTNYTLYTATTKNTAKTANMPTVTLYTTGYLSSSNEQNYYAYLDVRSDVNTTTVLHRYHFKYHRLYSTGAPSTSNDVQFNVWNICQQERGSLYSFAFVFANSNNTEYKVFFNGGGSRDTFETSNEQYKRFRFNAITLQSKNYNLAYIDCVSNNVEFYLSNVNPSNLTSLISCTTNYAASNYVRSHQSPFTKIVFDQKITTNSGSTRYFIEPSRRYYIKISSIMSFAVLDE